MATRIVVLDGFTLNPGDLSWTALEGLGACTVFDRTPPERVAERLSGVSIALTNKTVMDDPVLAALPDLRYIGVLATGYNVVDVAAAAARGIVVTNVPEYGTESVAQFVLAHILRLTSRVTEHAESVRAGDWSRCPDFCYWQSPLSELSGRTLGLVGLGRIGTAVAGLARAFGMTVLAHTPHPPASEADLGVQCVDLDTLFRESDVISLHCPLTEASREMVNADRLALMKPSALLINTARGGLVDEAALAEALRQGTLAGAGLDVLSREPPPPDHPLIGIDTCVITPHIAWATRAARTRLMDTAVDNVRQFLAGAPRNVVRTD